MILRDSVPLKIGIGSVIVVGALLLAHWLDRGTFAEELAMSQSTIEQTFRVPVSASVAMSVCSKSGKLLRLALDPFPGFSRLARRLLSSPAGKDKAQCFRCHAPHVREFPDKAQLFIDQAKAGDPSLDGVACAQCHMIKAS